MNCKEFDDNISLYIDGKLNSDEEKIFLDHSKHCQRCHIALENTERLVVTLQDLNHIKAPKGLSKSIIDALKDDVEEEEQENVGKTVQLDNHRRNRSGSFFKQMPWIKKASLAAVLVLIVTSAVILSNDWLPSPIQDDMMVMESGEESALEERAADESEPDNHSLENEEAQDSGGDIGITATEDGEDEFADEEGADEDLDGEALDEEAEAVKDPEESHENDAADTYSEGVEESEVDTFGIKYGEWIVLLLGIGVISVVVVLRKNRKN